MNDEFDWVKDDSVVIRPYEGIAVYENQRGDIVIRQPSDASDQDQLIVVQKQYIPVLIKALQDEA